MIWLVARWICVDAEIVGIYLINFHFSAMNKIISFEPEKLFQVKWFEEHVFRFGLGLGFLELLICNKLLPHEDSCSA